ncbi:hypothetical protein [Streptosporangium saharense]|uniref:hypothetical protein n=1 Tax=Streptosporangium saharense TaxID=1706840 RepID=UPI0036CFA333
MERVDWSRIPGPRWYLPETAQAVIEALTRSVSAEQAVRALADLRHAVTNDHAGALYPAAVPATSVSLWAIDERPGSPRQEAIDTLLDWWGWFPEPDFEIYEGSAGLAEGIMSRVRGAAEMLRRVADDPSGGGGHRPGAKLLLARLDEGWSETVD